MKTYGTRLAILAACCGIVGLAAGQTPPPPSPVPVITAGTSTVPQLTLPEPSFNNVPAVTPPKAEVSSVSPAERSIDKLLVELLAIRDQKAELEKREKAITETLVKKYKEQKAQLEKLGVLEPDPVLNISN